MPRHSVTEVPLYVCMYVQVGFPGELDVVRAAACLLPALLSNQSALSLGVPVASSAFLFFTVLPT